jgi:PAS domain S-box-containing protein
MAGVQPCKVLVVEDEGLIAHDIAQRLEAMGHTVVAIASTAEEALEHAPKAEIVLMDIRIDGNRDGVDAAAEIRAKYHTPVVFLTAHSDANTLNRAKQAGPFGYIVKPIAPASMNAAIEIARYKHRMERALEVSEAWQRAILGSVADAVIVSGCDDRIAMINSAAESLLGWAQAEARDQPVARVIRLLDPADPGVSAAADPLDLALLTDAPVAIDRAWRLIAKSGREMAVEGTAASVKAAGEPIGTVLTLRDVSLLRWEETQLRQSQKMEAVGRLAAGVASEFTNLLATIRTQSEHLMRQLAEYAPARQAIDDIHSAAVAAGQITNRLASFSTRQVGQPEVMSLNGVLRRMSKLIESVVGDRVELAIRPHSACHRIRADQAQMEQAVMNLVVHASTVMPAGGKLLVETGNIDVPVSGRITPFTFLSLTHSGAEPDPEQLFEPQSTGDEGLALSLVHSIVSEHGGYVSAHPAMGGFRFELLLPAWSEPVEARAPAVAGDAPAVLLVDPRERVRAQVHNFFEIAGYNVLEASDSDEAIALGLVHDGNLNLVIADAGAADGILKALRNVHPSLETLKVVDDATSDARSIRRPFTQAALLERVAELVPLPPKLEIASA